MNKRLVLLGDDEFLSDYDLEVLWAALITLEILDGVVVEVIYTDDEGMTQAINAALSTH